MLAVQAFAVQVIDLGVLVVGCVCALGFVVWLVRAGRWRNPLLGVEIPSRGPTAAGVAAVFLAFIALQYGVLGLLGYHLSDEELLRPGSTDWHWAQGADASIKVVMSVVMAVLLVQTGSLVGSGRRPTLRRGITVGVLGALIFVPLATLQLQMGRIVWDWVHPAAPAPTHPVLQAVGSSAWGTWGTLQLLAAALLVAPLAEELFFRGILLQAICRYTRQGWLAIAVSSVAFGFVHGQPQDILPLVTMGVVLGYVRLRLGALWPCVLLHMLFNARTMACALLAPQLVGMP